MKKLLSLILPLFLVGAVGWSVEKVKDGHKHQEEEHSDHSHEETTPAGHGHPDDHEAESEGHEHSGDEHGHGGHDEEERGDHEEGHHEHGEEEEGGGAKVGPDKGIQEASEKDGIKLSPEAIKNFELKTQKLDGAGPWRLPISARLMAGEEINVYRFRDGFYKRIDFREHAKDSQTVAISSGDLKNGDEVVIHGVGFLRIAEVAAFSTEEAGHHH